MLNQKSVVKLINIFIYYIKYLSKLIKRQKNRKNIFQTNALNKNKPKINAVSLDQDKGKKKNATIIIHFIFLYENNTCSTGA